MSEHNMTKYNSYSTAIAIYNFGTGKTNNDQRENAVITTRLYRRVTTIVAAPRTAEHVWIGSLQNHETKLVL